MDDPTNELDRLDYVEGQVHGLLAIMLAVAKSHPSPALLAREIEKAEQAALARTEASAVSDLMLAGMRDIIDRVRAIALAAKG